MITLSKLRVSKWIAGACLLILFTSNAYAGDKGSTSKNPVLFVHGYLGEFYPGNNSYWGSGFRNFLLNTDGGLGSDGLVEYHKWDTFGGVNGGTAASLRAKIDAMKASSGKNVNIVAHSFGGLLTRYYLKEFENDTKINKVVTIGTPHRGTDIARVAQGITRAAVYGFCSSLSGNSRTECYAEANDVNNSDGATQMIPDSYFVVLLNATVGVSSGSFLTIASEDDGVAPFDSANGVGSASKSETCSKVGSFAGFNTPWGRVAIHMNQLRDIATHRITHDFLFSNTRWSASNSKRKQAIQLACDKGTDPKDEHDEL